NSWRSCYRRARHYRCRQCRHAQRTRGSGRGRQSGARTDQENDGSMKRSIFLSILMPAYNEQPHIESVINEHIAAATTLADSLHDWEIVCLDDGSQYGTADVIVRLSQGTNKILLLRHAQNRGIYQSQRD